jgi:hypothetical protein
MEANNWPYTAFDNILELKKHFKYRRCKESVSHITSRAKRALEEAKSIEHFQQIVRERSIEDF